MGAIHKIEISPGTEISRAISHAIHIAATRSEDVCFAFNGVEVVVDQDSNPSVIQDIWSAKLNRQAEVYRNSPEGRNAAQQRDREISDKQTRIDRMMVELPGVLGDQPALMGWLRRFTEDADDVGVRFDGSALKLHLTAAGYVANDCVGMDPKVIESDPTLIARYIVGQAIDQLDAGMSPHPMLTRFVEDYRKILANADHVAQQEA